MLASSGTGAMEACITNFTRKKALTVNSGKFGERFGKICAAQNIEYTEIKNEWNTPVSVDAVVVFLLKILSHLLDDYVEDAGQGFAEVAAEIGIG